MKEKSEQYTYLYENPKVLFREQLSIPGVDMFGYANFQSANIALDTHWHTAKEFVVILDGTQTYYVDDKWYTLHGGDIFMTSPKEPHGNAGLPQNVCEFVFFLLDFSPENADNFLGLPVPYSRYVYEQIRDYDRRVNKTKKKDHFLLKEIFFFLASKEVQKRLLGYSLFVQFITNYLCSPELIQNKDRYSPDISEAVSYIHAHLCENVGIENVAKYVGLSSARFKAKFKEQMGITPHAYVLSVKIDTAKAMLEDPKNSVTDIAYQLNFSSSNHFTDVFKKYTGYTPSYYRMHMLEKIL